MIRYPIELNVRPTPYPAIKNLHFTENDTGNTLNVVLQDRGGFALDESMSSTITYERSDGKTFVTNSSIDLETNAVVGIIPKEAVHLEGKGLISIQLYNGGRRITTLMLEYNVVRELAPDSVIEDSGEYIVLIELLEEVRGIKSDLDNYHEDEVGRKLSEVIRVEQEDSRIASEVFRSDNEGERLASELIRGGNEQARQDNEAERSTDEVVRKSNEVVRIGNEDGRESNEGLRIASEEVRVNNENIRIDNMTVVRGWLDNPEQFKGDKGDRGEEFLYSDFTEEQLDLLIGPRGPKGDKGEVGTGLNILGSFDNKSELPGTGEIGDAYLILGDLYVWDGSEFLNVGNIRGPKGEQGIQGKTGPKGEQGIQGIQGERGEQGIQGIQGEKGEQGDGINYEDLSPEEIAEITGPKGEQGIQGPKGEQGDIGPKGDKGEDGIIGKDGEPGPKGDKGEPGIQGPQGEQGPKGDPFVYEDFTPTQLDGLKGPKGDKGDKGDTGDTPSLNSGHVITALGYTPATKTEVDEHKTEKASKTQMGHVKIDNKTIVLNNSGEIEVYEPPIYGIEIDEANSNPETAVTYTDDAVGFTPASGNNGAFNWGSWESIIKDEFIIKPCVLNNPAKTVNYYLDYDNYNLKATGGASNLTGADGDVMTEFGADIYTKWTVVGSKHKIQFSVKPFEGATKNAFETENGYNQFAYYPLLLTQKLFQMIFKNRDSQTVLGRGYVDGNSAYVNTGGTNTKGFMFGETTGKQQMKFLGIEDYWGNKYQWIDGLVTDASYNLLIGNSGFNDSGSGYTSYSSGVSANTGGYIDTVQGGNDKGFIIKGKAGSETTHYCDYGGLNSGRVARFGGYRSDGSDAGFARLRLSNAASNADAAIGARLICVNNGKLYIGAYLGTTQNGKLRSVSGATPSDNKTISVFRSEAKANNV